MTIYLPKSWIRVLNHTSFAVDFHVSIALDTDHGTVLYVEVLQTSAIVRNVVEPNVANYIAVLDTELL